MFKIVERRVGIDGAIDLGEVCFFGADRRQVTAAAMAAAVNSSKGEDAPTVKLLSGLERERARPCFCIAVRGRRASPKERAICAFLKVVIRFSYVCAVQSVECSALVEACWQGLHRARGLQDGVWMKDATKGGGGYGVVESPGV